MSNIISFCLLYLPSSIASLKEVEGAVFGAGVGADAPLVVAVHVLPAGGDHSAAPGLALVLSPILPLSTPGVCHALELEREHALLTSSGASDSGALRLEGLSQDVNQGVGVY